MEQLKIWAALRCRKSIQMTIKRSRLTTRDGFFMFKICNFYWYFVYLVIDLQVIKYEFQALQPTTNDTFTLLV